MPVHPSPLAVPSFLAEQDYNAVLDVQPGHTVALLQRAKVLVALKQREASLLSQSSCSRPVQQTMCVTLRNAPPKMHACVHTCKPILSDLPAWMHGVDAGSAGLPGAPCQLSGADR